MKERGNKDQQRNKEPQKPTRDPGRKQGDAPSTGENVPKRSDRMPGAPKGPEKQNR